ncbi:MAG: hypothetical protein ACREBZ_05625 [Thermoplasmata archaeon]
MKRLPHAVHSADVVPSSFVEKRRAPPHSRHGRAELDIRPSPRESSRGGGRSRNRGAETADPALT